MNNIFDKVRCYDWFTTLPYIAIICSLISTCLILVKYFRYNSLSSDNLLLLIVNFAIFCSMLLLLKK